MRCVAIIAGSLALTTLSPDAALAAQGPGLRVAVVTNGGLARPGGLLAYGLSLRNPGIAALSGMTAVARLAAGTAVVDVSAPPGARCREAAHTVTCHLAPLTARATSELWITTVVRPRARRTLRATFTVRADGLAPAATTVGTPVLRGPDLGVRLHAARRGPALVRVTTVVRNRGPHAAHGVTVHLGLGRGLAFHYRGARCRVPGRSFLRCALGVLPAGARRVLRLTVHEYGRAEFAASISPDLGDPRPADNTALATAR
jgi:hypothetical protein